MACHDEAACNCWSVSRTGMEVWCVSQNMLLRLACSNNFASRVHLSKMQCGQPSKQWGRDGRFLQVSEKATLVARVPIPQLVSLGDRHSGGEGCDGGGP